MNRRSFLPVLPEVLSVHVAPPHHWCRENPDAQECLSAQSLLPVQSLLAA